MNADSICALFQWLHKDAFRPNERYLSAEVLGATIHTTCDKLIRRARAGTVVKHTPTELKVQGSNPGRGSQGLTDENLQFETTASIAMKGCSAFFFA